MKTAKHPKQPGTPVVDRPKGKHRERPRYHDGRLLETLSDADAFALAAGTALFIPTYDQSGYDMLIVDAVESRLHGEPPDLTHPDDERETVAIVFGHVAGTMDVTPIAACDLLQYATR